MIDKDEELPSTFIIVMLRINGNGPKPPSLLTDQWIGGIFRVWPASSATTITKSHVRFQLHSLRPNQQHYDGPLNVSHSSSTNLLNNIIPNHPRSLKSLIRLD